MQIQLDNHEERISKIEKETLALRHDIKHLQEATKDSYLKLDESNKYLRDMTTHQTTELAKMYEAILTGNNDAKKREDNRRARLDTNRHELWKIILSASGIVGLLMAIIQAVISAYLN